MTAPNMTALVAAGVAVVALGGAAALLLTDDSSDSSASSPPATAPVDGRALFQLKGCASCHDGPDSRSEIGVGPSLVNAAAWGGTRRAGLSAADYVRESILAPSAFVSPAAESWEMPTLTLTADEVERLVSYLLEE